MMTAAAGEEEEVITRHLGEILKNPVAIPESDSDDENDDGGAGNVDGGRGRRVTLQHEDLPKIRLVAAVLRPFYEATIMLEGDEDVSISCVLPELKQLAKLAIASSHVELEGPIYKQDKAGKIRLEKAAVTVHESELPKEVADLRKRLMEGLDKRWGAESKIASLNRLYRLSAALDPRFRDSPLLTTRDQGQARKLVEKEAVELTAKDRGEAAASDEERPKKKGRTGEVAADERFLRWQAEADAAAEAAEARKAKRAGGDGGQAVGAEEENNDDDEEEVDGEVAVREEVQRYFKLKISNASLSQSPVKWWRERCGAFPVLSKLAAKYLSVPASSASVERVFSQAGLTLTKLRNRMGSDTLEELLMLKYHHATHGCKYFTPSQWAQLTQGIADVEEEGEGEAPIVVD